MFPVCIIQEACGEDFVPEEGWWPWSWTKPYVFPPCPSLHEEGWWQGSWNKLHVFPVYVVQERVLKILFINFMKKTDNDDHEMSSTCFPSVSSRKRVLKTSFTKKGWYLQARSQSGLKLTSHSWGTMHRSPGKRNNMWCLMGSQNAQHTGWVVADMTCQVIKLSTQDGWWLATCQVIKLSTQDGWWLATCRHKTQHTGWVVANNMTSHNAQHMGWVVADNMSWQVTMLSTQDGWWLTCHDKSQCSAHRMGGGWQHDKSQCSAHRMGGGWQHDKSQYSAHRMGGGWQHDKSQFSAHRMGGGWQHIQQSLQVVGLKERFPGEGKAPKRF